MLCCKCSVTVFGVKRFFMDDKLPHCSPRGWGRHPHCAGLGRPHVVGRATELRLREDGYETRPKSPLPGDAITHDRVEDGQQLAGDRDDGDLLGLAGCDEALEEGLEHGVVPPGHHSAHEQRFAHARPATADEALAAPLARLTREGGKPDKRRDLLAAEGPKLRQLGNERARNYRPDARHRGEQILFLAPGWRTTHGIVNLTVDTRELTLERLQEPADALPDAGISPFLTLSLCTDHVDDLTPAGNEIGKLLGGLVGQRPWCDAGRLAEVGDHLSIDLVGLGALTDGFGEGADLRRIGDRDRQAGPGEGRNDHGLEPAGGLEHDEVGLQHLETGYEFVQSGASTRDHETLTTRTHGNIEAVFRNVDTAYGLVHGDP